MKFSQKIRKKKKSVSFILFVILTLSIYFFFFQKEEQKPMENLEQLEITAVSRGNLAETIKVLGKSKLINEQKLRFNLTGRITAVNFADGDSVKKDDIIAELDKADVQNEIKQMEISLENAKIDLKKLLEGNSSLEIKRAENALNLSKKNLELEEKSLDLSKQKQNEEITKIEKNLTRAQDNLFTKNKVLDDAITKLDNIGLSTKESAEKNDYSFYIKDSNLGLNGIVLVIDDVINNLDSLFDEDLNDEYRNYLGILKSETINEAKVNYKKSITEKDRIKAEFEKIYDQNLSLTELESFLNDLKNVFKLLTDASSDAYEVLEYSETGVSFSQSDLNSLKSTFSGLRSSSETQIKAIEQLLETVTQAQETVRLAKEEVKIAQEDFEELQKSSVRLKEESSIVYQKSQNNYMELLKKIAEDEEALVNLKKNKEESITRAKNNVTLQELALEKTLKTISKYELSAPFDGLIRKIDFKVGDNLINEESKYAYLENPDVLKITINLDQLDAVKVKAGQSAKIVFDALPEKEFVGKIEEINQSPKEENGLISYQATLTLEKEGARIFSGMTASVEIFVNERQNVLLVPILAVQDGFVKKKLNENEFVEVPVEKGIDNGVEVEIISGLEDGDEVVVLDYQAVDSAMENYY